MIPSKTIWLYRITHISNLGYVLRHGLHTRQSPLFDPNYINIGDPSLIDYRRNIDARNPPGGKLADYIPFYLGPRSPMLYQIAKGFEDVTQYNQTDIIYLISSFNQVIKHDLQYFFTDANARANTANYYISITDFERLDWKSIYDQYWKSDETDLERKQKKQAEFLIKTHVPVSCIEYIGVFDEPAKQKVAHLLEQQNLRIKIRVSPDKLYYDNL